MDPHLGKVGFRMAFYIVFVAGGLLLVLERGTAEFVITLFTFILGLVFLLLVAALVRWGQRRRF